MENIYRVFAEKREGFNVEAKNLLADIKAQLGIPGLKNVRILARYDVSGIDDETFRVACRTIFAEPNADIVTYDMPHAVHYIIRELQTGTYDQRADSAEQCIRMLAPEFHPVVKTAVVFIFDGELTHSDMDRLRRYLINPVESREGSVNLTKSLTDEAPVPALTRKAKCRAS